MSKLLFYKRLHKYLVINLNYFQPNSCNLFSICYLCFIETKRIALNKLTGDIMTKLVKKDSVPFLNVLHKLTDKRFSFNIVHTFDLGVQGYNLEMSFMGDFVASCSIPEFHITTAVYCLIDLINYADKQNHSDYFDKFGVSFEIYHNKLDGKNYFSFRKNDSDKWVKISDKVAAYILGQNDIVINGLCDSVVSYCQYDCYYNINLKGG